MILSTEFASYSPNGDQTHWFKLSERVDPSSPAYMLKIRIIGQNVQFELGSAEKKLLPLTLCDSDQEKYAFLLNVQETTNISMDFLINGFEQDSYRSQYNLINVLRAILLCKLKPIYGEDWERKNEGDIITELNEKLASAKPEASESMRCR